MTTAFTFTTNAEHNRAELERFAKAARNWKPSDYNRDADRRLTYFLWRQRELLVLELKQRYPETFKEMKPVTLPVTKFFVRELAKVFLDGASMPLVGEDDKAVDAGADEAKAWAQLQEDVALGLKLKGVDRYTTLFSTCFLRWGHSDAGVTAQIVLPHRLEAVMDEAFPMDLDRAHAVRIELSSEAGPSGEVDPETQRFEFFCARKGEELHAIVRGDGTLEYADRTYPYADDGSRPIVPLIAFTQHTEELGLFPLVGQGLHEFNLAVDLAVTSLFEIAETQGWGELIVTVPDGAKPPAKITRGPRRAVPLSEGVTANVLNYNAPIADLVEKLDQDLKRAALLNNIPPGAVSLEARAVASGVALQIEMRPLLEARKDSVEVYALPMRRVWQVAAAVWNAYAAGGEGKPFPAGLRARWEPGDVQMPESEDALVERMLLEKRAGWRSSVEAVATIRNVSEEEATEILAKVRKQKDQDPAGDPTVAAGLSGDNASIRARVEFPPPGKPGAEPPPEPGAVPAAAPTDGAAVVQDTALNGSQVSSLLEIVQAAVDRDLSLETAQALVEAAFPGIRSELVARIMAGVKKTPAKPAAPAPPIQPPPPPPGKGAPPPPPPGTE